MTSRAAARQGANRRSTGRAGLSEPGQSLSSCEASTSTLSASEPLTSKRVLLACAILAVLCIAAYAPVANLGFLQWDDSDYTYANPHVAQGLTWPNAAWAFTSLEKSNWHPLTWLSLMLDVSLHGLAPGQLHVTNVGEIFRARGRLDEAAANYADALRGNPGIAEAYLGLARISMARRNPREAERQFQEALVINPDLAQAQEGLRAAQATIAR